MTRCGPAVIATQLASGAAPTYTNIGVTQTQVLKFLGHDGVLTPEKPNLPITFATVSGASATKFLDPTTDRGADSGELIFLWLFGLRSTDTLHVKLIYHLQYYPVSTAAWLDTSAVQIVGANSNAADLTSGIVTASVASGNDVKQGSPQELAQEASASSKHVDKAVEKAKNWDIVDNLVDAAGSVLEFLPSMFSSANRGERRVPMSVALRLCSNVPRDHACLNSLTARFASATPPSSLVSSSLSSERPANAPKLPDFLMVERVTPPSR